MPSQALQTSGEQTKHLQARGHVTENWASNPGAMVMRGLSPPSPPKGASFRGQRGSEVEQRCRLFRRRWKGQGDLQQKLPLSYILLTVILAFGMLRQEDYKVKDGFSCVERPYLNKREE